VFDVPAQVKDVAPQNPRITVALTSGHRGAVGVRSVPAPIQ
jgi:hypothetical protein